MSVRFRFALRNFGPLEEGLAGVVQDLSDLGPFFKKHFVPAYLQTMQLQFESEGGLTGFWEGLTPEYEAWKNKRYPGRLINQRTRKLVRSFSPGGRSQNLEIKIKPRSAIIRSLVPYAFWVNLFRPIMVPPRRLNRAKYQKMLEEYVQGVVDKHLKKPKFSTAEKGTASGGFFGNIGR